AAYAWDPDLWRLSGDYEREKYADHLGGPAEATLRVRAGSRMLDRDPDPRTCIALQPAPRARYRACGVGPGQAPMRQSGQCAFRANVRARAVAGRHVRSHSPFGSRLLLDEEDVARLASR